MEQSLTVRAKPVKLLEKNIEVNLHDVGIGNGILDMTPKPGATKLKSSKLKMCF